jgi:hypothetical protein
MAANDYAVVIGINHYPSPNFLHLQGPENDACTFYDWLVSPEYGQVPVENITLLLSSDFTGRIQDDPLQAKPTLGELEHPFNTLIQIAKDKKRRIGRRLYIFLAGHGISTDLQDAALLAANVDWWRIGYHLSGPLVRDWFHKAGLFQEVVLYMDCCRSIYKAARPRPVPWHEEEEPGDARLVLSHTGLAAKWGVKSFEALHDGRMRGIFSASLINALYRSRDAQGCITTRSVRNFVFNDLAQRGITLDGSEPEFDGPRGSQDIVLVEAPPPADTIPVTVEFLHPDPHRNVVVLDADFTPVIGPQPMLGEWYFELPAGQYMLHIPGEALSDGLAFKLASEESYHVQF